MLSVLDFATQYPQYSIDFSIPLKEQSRIYHPEQLSSLPMELSPSHEYRSGGRGRPNLNQTLTHWQCKSCKRVLRNDFFYAPPSLVKRNVLFTHCIICTQGVNSNRYRAKSSTIRKIRTAIWQYLASKCTVCGFDHHISAMDMHHIGNKENEIATLITAVTFAPNPHNIQRLLAEASQCIAICSNCHRMLHANAIGLEEDKLKPPHYRLVELTRLLEEIKAEPNHE